MSLGSILQHRQEAGLTYAGIQLANLDTTALLGANFYQYACGAWYEAFNVTEKDLMFLPQEKRVAIW